MKHSLCNKGNRRGDTLVEVMLSMAVIGMVIGGAYTISNKATQLSRLAQQRTQANNLMRSQAELLKLFRDNNTLQWSSTTNGVSKYITGAPDKPPAFKPVNCTTSIDERLETNHVFYVRSDNTIAAYDSSHPDASGDPTGQYQIWVEPYRTPSSGYTDFYIIGCWQGPGSYGQQQSFIVERLNDPS